MRKKMRPIHANIRAARERRKLSQAELAKKLGVHETAVSKWETGDCAPRERMLGLLVEILGTSHNALRSSIIGGLAVWVASVAWAAQQWLSAPG